MIDIIQISQAISTHTLTWSVTYSVTLCFSQCFISTHTLTWSVTHLFMQFFPNISISTHTLTWSVTGLFQQSIMIPQNFNSHAHVERDNAKYQLNMANLQFQLTRSRGA